MCAKIRLTVIFGTAACNAYDAYGYYGAVNRALTDCGDVGIREFDTEAEKKAYLEGLDDAYGWNNFMALTDEQISEDVKLFFAVGNRVHWHDPALIDYDNPAEALNRVFYIQSINEEEGTAWISEDIDSPAQTEVYLTELELIDEDDD